MMTIPRNGRQIAPLTVAISTIDRPDRLSCCLQALAAGRVIPAEIVVVDQGRDDRTRQAVEDCSGGPTRLVYIHSDVKGLAAAQNLAIRAAQSELLAITDDDCEPAPDWVATIVRIFTAPDSPGLLAGRVLPMGPDTPGAYAVSSRTSTQCIDFDRKAQPLRQRGDRLLCTGVGTRHEQLRPHRFQIVCEEDGLRLSDRRYLVIIVAPDGDVQNRVVFTDTDYTQQQLIEAANYLNAHYAGMAIEQVRERLKCEVESLRSEIAQLMQTAVNATDEALHQAQEEVVISGERNLLSVSEFNSDLGNLRRLFDLFEQKTQLVRLLDVSTQADGVRIYIGGESQVMPFQDLSIVTAPYEVDGQVVGTLGVIGPQRMPYDRMIQIVDVTAKLVSNALSHTK